MHFKNTFYISHLCFAIIYFYVDLSKPVCVIGYTLTLVMLPTFFWITRVVNTMANEMLVGYVGA